MTSPSIHDAIIFTDGACIPNPGPGGYAALLVSRGEEIVITGGEPDTTNIRMEMIAVIRALEELPGECGAVIHSNSQLVINGMTKWLEDWKRRGWRNASKVRVANRDLWERLDNLAEGRTLDWWWVRGSARQKENERVDGLANAEAMRMRAQLGLLD